MLSAGVYNSPAILQRSGIGPAQWLKRHGIRRQCRSSRRNGTDRSSRLRLFLPRRRHFADDGPALCRQLAGRCPRRKRAVVAYASVSRRRGGRIMRALHLSVPAAINGDGRDRRRRSRHRSRSSIITIWRAPATWPVSRDSFEGIKALLASKPFQRHNARVADWRRMGLETHLLTMLVSAHHQSSTCRMGTGPENQRGQSPAFSSRHRQSDGGRFEHFPRHRHAQYQSDLPGHR